MTNRILTDYALHCDCGAQGHATLEEDEALQQQGDRNLVCKADLPFDASEGWFRCTRCGKLAGWSSLTRRRLPPTYAVAH